MESQEQEVGIGAIEPTSSLRVDGFNFKNREAENWQFIEELSEELKIEAEVKGGRYKDFFKKIVSFEAQREESTSNYEKMKSKLGIESQLEEERLQGMEKTLIRVKKELLKVKVEEGSMQGLNKLRCEAIEDLAATANKLQKKKILSKGNASGIKRLAITDNWRMTRSRKRPCITQALLEDLSAAQVVMTPD